MITLQIESAAQNVTTGMKFPLLRPDFQVYRSDGNPEWTYDDAADYFPPLSRPLQRYRNWWELDTVTEDLLHKSYRKYDYLYAIGKVHRPYLIAEFGAGFGHSLMAMASGARAAGQPHATANGYDPETETPGCVEWAREWFMQSRIPYNISHCSSRQFDASGVPLKHIDLFHIDGNPAEVAQDLALMPPTLSDRGIVVISNQINPDLSVLTIPGFSATLLPENIVLLERR